MTAAGAIYWSPRLGRAGEVVTDLDDIDQSIRILLRTRRSTVPHDPLFGTDIFRWLDAPADVALPSIVMEVREAIRMFEPRAEFAGCTVRHPAPGHSVLTVTWRPAGELAGTGRTTEVPIHDYAA